MWKESAVAYFKLLSEHFPGETKENKKLLRTDGLLLAEIRNQ
jgi:hypothetical protein